MDVIPKTNWDWFGGVSSRYRSKCRCLCSCRVRKLHVCMGSERFTHCWHQEQLEFCHPLQDAQINSNDWRYNCYLFKTRSESMESIKKNFFTPGLNLNCWLMNMWNSSINTYWKSWATHIKPGFCSTALPKRWKNKLNKCRWEESLTHC